MTQHHVSQETDDLAAARGLLFATPLSLILWFAIFEIALWVL